MRQSHLLLTTLRELPADAEVISHQLMLRAGYIRQLAAGIYTYMPLGRRVLRKVEQIVRDEMDRADAQEVLMPVLQPAELWKESGRYSVYGPELMRLHDRHEREFALGPTHEEVITSIVRNEINSYRKLPVTLYQIQTKFRDERRPRFGLLRGREFLMKDAYSFDMDWEGLDQSYSKMFEAYKRIFTRCGIKFRAVEADAGAIGGEGGTHEFMALADIGEDTIAACTCCEYAANLEKAESTIDKQVQSLQSGPSALMKTLNFIADGQTVAVVVRGDHEINESKVKHYLRAENISLADSEAVEKITGVTIPVLVDHAAANIPNGIAGDFRNVIEGEGCPRCSEGQLTFYRGIEMGHVFKLGTKYSEKLGATFLDSSGRDQTMIMGCYGIGVSRILSAVLEQSHDELGMIWPLALAPFHVHLIPVSVKDELQMQVVTDLYNRLLDNGIEVLVDDRNERPGVKFKDSDLIGIPIRIVIGKDALQGNVEYIERSHNKKESMSSGAALERIIELVNKQESPG